MNRGNFGYFAIVRKEKLSQHQCWPLAQTGPLICKFTNCGLKVLICGFANRFLTANICGFAVKKLKSTSNSQIKNIAWIVSLQFPKLYVFTIQRIDRFAWMYMYKVQHPLQSSSSALKRLFSMDAASLTAKWVNLTRQEASNGLFF